MTDVVHFKSPINTKSYLKKVIVISVYKSQNLKHFVGKTFFFLSDLNYSYNLQQKYDRAVISSWLLHKN